jgi:hypothetical protein
MMADVVVVDREDYNRYVEDPANVSVSNITA